MTRVPPVPPRYALQKTQGHDLKSQLLRLFYLFYSYKFLLDILQIRALYIPASYSPYSAASFLNSGSEF